MKAYETTHTLSLMEAHTIADALTAYALLPESTDERIRNVTASLRAIGYIDTADVLERMHTEERSALLKRIDAYTRGGE